MAGRRCACLTIADLKMAASNDAKLRKLTPFRCPISSKIPDHNSAREKARHDALVASIMQLASRYLA
jgi:hypothetical protein